MPEPTSTAYPPSPQRPGHAPLVELVADGGLQTGFGHVGRCLALAEALGDEAVFSLSDATTERFVTARGARAGGAPSSPVVVLDRVEPTSAEEVSALRDLGRRVALLDDRGPGRAVADVVIDPPTAAEWPEAGGRRLSGFEHVLLRNEVRNARRSPEPHGVLLALGGSDPEGLTPTLATALGDLDDLAVNLGPGYTGPSPGTGEVLSSDPGAFIDAMASTRLLVSTYGHSLLEAAHLGVPAVIVALRPRQHAHAHAFVANGTAEIASPAEVPGRVAELLGDARRLQAMSVRGPQLVDGRGSDRVADALRALAA